MLDQQNTDRDPESTPAYRIGMALVVALVALAYWLVN